MISYNHPVPNTFGIGCLAARYVEFASVEELEQSLAGAAEPFLFVGEGSNLLFTGDRFEGTVFHNGMRDIEILQDDGDYVVVKVGGGYIWDEFVSCAVANGWHGAENLSLIPGQVGSAAVQNIGAYGAEVKDILVSVETFDIRSRQLRVFDNAGCGFGYRRSFFKTPEGSGNIVLSVTFSLSRKSAFNLEYGNLRQFLPAGADISLS
ncbi:MAG: FAD-binding protein, partial [Bacteroidales bacterium]|nr:FAD-binding protein [Bacteroidales bacterium]